ncbi:MAG: Rrf2 family transcriptional regulator [Chloroflexota bacterium]
MRLSSRGRYATKAMIDLAVHFNQGPVLAKDISARQGITEPYLEQLFIPLRAAGLVRSLRGTGGGFYLARPPAEVKLGDIIRASEGTTSPVECADEPRLCPQSSQCVSRDVWVEMKRAIDGVLDATTLEDLVQQQNARGETTPGTACVGHRGARANPA